VGIMENDKELFKIKGSYKPTYFEMKSNGFRAIPTEVLLTIISSDFEKGEMKVLLHIFHETYGFFKLRGNKHRFCYNGISEMTGISKKQISRILKRLENKGIIRREINEDKTINITLLLSHYPRWEGVSLDNAHNYLNRKKNEKEKPMDEEEEEPGDTDVHPRGPLCPLPIVSETPINKELLEELDKL
jgi:DNA-binding HxlR family transcriptional regulator